jgi:hypothetical protein
MRRVLLVVSILAVVPFCVFAVGHAVTRGAQEATPMSVDSFVGAWRVTVSPPQGQPHPGLITFAADGTLLAADLPTTLLFSGGHGAWEPTGQDAAFTFDILVATETGMPIGTLTLRGTAALGSDKQSLSAAYTVDFADPTGQVVSTGQGSLQGTRIGVEPPGTLTDATPMAGTPAT